MTVSRQGRRREPAPGTDRGAGTGPGRNRAGREPARPRRDARREGKPARPHAWRAALLRLERRAQDGKVRVPGLAREPPSTRRVGRPGPGRATIETFTPS